MHRVQLVVKVLSTPVVLRSKTAYRWWTVSGQARLKALLLYAYPDWRRVAGDCGGNLFRFSIPTEDHVLGYVEADGPHSR